MDKFFANLIQIIISYKVQFDQSYNKLFNIPVNLMLKHLIMILFKSYLKDAMSIFEIIKQ